MFYPFSSPVAPVPVSRSPHLSPVDSPLDFSPIIAFIIYHSLLTFMDQLTLYVSLAHLLTLIRNYLRQERLIREEKLWNLLGVKLIVISKTRRGSISILLGEHH